MAKTGGNVHLNHQWQTINTKIIKILATISIGDAKIK